MGALLKYGKQLVGKHFFFEFSGRSPFIGEIKSIVSTEGGTLIVNYSPVYAGGTADWRHSHFDLGSEVDEWCIVFDKVENLVKFFELFFGPGRALCLKEK